jgi:hypothetical protein
VARNRQDLVKALSMITSELLKEKGYICFIDVFMKLGYLSQSDYENWRFQRVSDVSTLFRTQNLIGFQSLLIGQWREIAIRGMAALTVIEHFDVFKHSCLGLFVRVKPLQINQLGL